MNPLDQHLSVFKRQASDLMQTIHAICSLFDVEGAGVSPNKRIAAIQRTVCEYYDLPLSIMSSRIRTQRNAQARHVALYLSRELTKLPLETIASTFRRDMDHGTVCHACKAVTTRLETDHAFTSTLATLRVNCIESIESITMPLFHQTVTTAKK